jgi:hypothetical protein
VQDVFSVSYRSHSTLQSSSLVLKGVYVSIEDTIKGFNMIMDGKVDEYPEAAFNLVEPLKKPLKKVKNFLPKQVSNSIVAPFANYQLYARRNCNARCQGF